MIINVDRMMKDRLGRRSLSKVGGKRFETCFISIKINYKLLRISSGNDMNVYEFPVCARILKKFSRMLKN